MRWVCTSVHAGACFLSEVILQSGVTRGDNVSPLRTPRSQWVQQVLP